MSLPPLVKVDLTAAPRFNARPAHLTPLEAAAWRQFKTKAIAKHWIQPSRSRHSCGFMFVPKKDGTLRFVINYGRLNDIIKPRVYAPRVDPYLRQSIASARWYTKLDIRDGFYHIRILPSDTWKLAFRSPDGLYEMTVLPQGLSISPAEFQMYIEEVLASFIGPEVTVHIDDILIYAASRKRCADLTRAVLARLRTRKLEIASEKCSFVVPEVNYCGYVYGAGKFRPEDRTETIRNWPTPRNVTELRGFLGLGNVFHGHVRRYASIATPLYDVTGKDFQWNARQEAAFAALKKALCNSITLNEHDQSANATLTTDASLVGIGGLLSQKGKITAVWSRKLTPSERNYDAAKRELLAVVECLKRWQPYLEMAPHILIKTDNSINAATLKPSSNDRQRNRMIEIVERHKVTWQHIPGLTNPADGPSRRPDYGSTDTARMYLKGGRTRR